MADETYLVPLHLIGEERDALQLVADSLKLTLAEAARAVILTHLIEVKLLEGL